MILSRPVSLATRSGLLIVAAIHFFAAATLSFTHSHLPAAGGPGIVTDASEQQEGAPHGHTDICVICQALASAHFAAGRVQAFSDVPPRAVAAAFEQADAAAVPTYTSSHPRAPPRV